MVEIMDEKEKQEQDIEDILKNIRKHIKPAKGPLTSIDPKKLAKAINDVKTAQEIEKLIKKK